MTNAPKPVFPAGYEPPGLRRDEYLTSGQAKPLTIPSGREYKPVRRVVDICWYCGDELTGKYADISTETRSAECGDSPTGVHELEEIREPCAECEGTGQCQECKGLGCVECRAEGICQTCDGEGTEPDVQLWNRSDDTYLGGFSDRGWDPQRESLKDYQKRESTRTVTSAKDYWWKPGGSSTSYDWRKPYKPEPPTWRNWFWSEFRSREAAKSDNLFVQVYGKYRDAQDNYASCPEKRHWGPRGGAGLVPWTVAPDGEVYVLLSHRSRLVENGGTWSSFGGAIDKGDKTPLAAAVREAFEEVEGLPTEGHITKEVARPCHACGWLYTTFLIRIEPTAVRVNRKGHSGWETEGVKWVKLADVDHYNLHPGFKKTWPELAKAIMEAPK